ncbi:MAG: restriction endonuclease subunit S [Methanothrix sp.]|nr:restriction endonuclease subunit S [Methanothrix sp.]
MTTIDTKWPVVQLDEVCDILKRGINPQREPSSTFAHYSLPAFDSTAGPQIELGETIKSQKTIIENGVVLVSKLNPRIPRVWLIEDEQKYQRICSTEFVPLRCNTKRLNNSFLAYALRHSLTTGQIVGSTSAATKSRERVRPTDFLRLKVHIPPLEEQRRIVDILARAEGIVRLRREAQKKAEEIIPALFLYIFGDPATNPKGLAKAELGKFLSFITSGSRGWAKHYAPEGARFLRSLDVQMNNISDQNAVYVNPPEGAETNRTRVKEGDVLLTITGSQIGRVAAVPEAIAGSFISQHVAILRLKPGVSPIFLSLFLSMDTGGQREISRLQYGQTKPGLNLSQIRKFVIPVPPMPLQQKFVVQMNQLRSILQLQADAVKQVEATFDALLARAFSTTNT